MFAMYRISRILILIIGLVLSTGAAILFGFTEAELPWSVCMAVWMAGFGMIRFSSRKYTGERRV